MAAERPDREHDRSGSRGPTPLVAAAGFAAAFVLLTWPLCLSPFDAVISHWDADAEHSLWVQWWLVRAMGSGEPLFRTDMLSFPAVASLQLADLNLAVLLPAALVSPLVGLAGAYNALLLGAFLASGLLTFQLTRRLGADPPAAWLAGLLFAGSPYWQACALNGWGYLVHTGVFPLIGLALLRVREDPSAARWLGLALALGLAFHVTPYYFLYSLVLLALLGLAEAGVWRDLLRRSRPVGWVLGVAAGVALVLPRAVPMWRASRVPLVAHHGPDNTELAAALVELVTPSAGAVAGRAPETGYLVVFLGYTLLCTLVAGIAVSRQRRAYLPWLLAAGGMLVLALGPHPRWSAHAAPVAIPLPASWLQTLPGFSLTTNHWRWVGPASFCLCVALARAVTDLRRRARASGGERFVTAAVLCGFALELVFVFPLPLRKPLWDARPSPVAAALRERDDVRALVDRSGRPKRNQTVHGKAIALGWIPRISVETRRAQERLARECHSLDPACLRRYGIDAVIRDDTRALLLRGSPEEIRVESR